MVGEGISRIKVVLLFTYQVTIKRVYPDSAFRRQIGEMDDPQAIRAPIAYLSTAFEALTLIIGVSSIRVRIYE
jgi:hypothetical protein